MILCGDINTDFGRHSEQVALVSEAVTEMNLLKIWDKYDVDFTCVQNNDENIGTSVIDHFFCSAEIGNHILDAGVIHSPENRSDHSPVYCVLSTLNIKLDTSDQFKENSKPSWKSSTEEQKQQYKQNLEEKLNSISVPSCVVQCKNVKCSSTDHCDSVGKITENG